MGNSYDEAAQLGLERSCMVGSSAAQERTAVLNLLRWSEDSFIGWSDHLAGAGAILARVDYQTTGKAIQDVMRAMERARRARVSAAGMCRAYRRLLATLDHASGLGGL